MSHLYKMVKNTNEKMTGAYNKWYARPVYNEPWTSTGLQSAFRETPPPRNLMPRPC